jgi:predicted alpha/beta superfamily hydrolase
MTSCFFPMSDHGESGSPLAQPASPVLQNPYRLHHVSSDYLPFGREVIVYLPQAYFSEPGRRFPVLYLHDGNNLFDASTSFCGDIWAPDQALEAGVAAGQIEPAILVGIYNSLDRMNEYTWSRAGQAYCAFVAEELKPLIDAHYRTLPEREHTGVIGSSMGGLISFYFGLHYPEVFGNIGLMSPSLGWKGGIAMREASHLSPELKVWVDIGTRECWHPRWAQWMVEYTSTFVQELEHVGFRHFENLAFHIAEGADHSERAWAERIHQPLSFFYAPRQTLRQVA